MITSKNIIALCLVLYCFSFAWGQSYNDTIVVDIDKIFLEDIKVTHKETLYISRTPVDTSAKGHLLLKMSENDTVYELRRAVVFTNSRGRINSLGECRFPYQLSTSENASILYEIILDSRYMKPSSYSYTPSLYSYIMVRIFKILDDGRYDERTFYIPIYLMNKKA